MPGFRCLPPEGAFYAWVDITGTGIVSGGLCAAFCWKMPESLRFPAQPSARAGRDFIRFSFASSTATLHEAVERILKVSAAWQGTAAVR